MKNWLTIITTCLNEVIKILNHLHHLSHLSEFGIEIILIDGGSKDRTLDIIEQFNKDKIKVLKFDKLSIYQAFNVGIKESTTKYLSFLGVGDILNDFFLIEVKRKLTVFPYDIIYGDLVYYDTRKCFKYKFRSYEIITNRDIKLFPFSHSGSIQKKELFNIFGEFDISYKIASDYEWLCRVVSYKSLIAKKIKTIQSNMELGGFSTNKKYHKILHDETSRIRKTYSISTSYKTRMIKIVFNVNQFLRNHLIKS